MATLRLHAEEAVETPSPSPLVRGVVSLLVVGHFLAIAVAVTSYSTPNFPAPQLAVAASEPLQPYLQATFLNNAYRFFAPNPGTPTVFWLRLQDDDGTVRWTELPGAAGTTPLRAAYQRRLNLALLLGQQMAPDPAQGGKPRFTPLGETCLASVVRHIVYEQARTDAHGSPIPVASVGVYLVQHAVVTPQQVREGWTPTDLRTHRPFFIGAFKNTGEPLGERQPAREQPIGEVVAGILWADLHPRLRSGRASRESALESLRLPPPVDGFLKTHSALLGHGLPADGLKERVEQLMAGG